LGILSETHLPPRFGGPSDSAPSVIIFSIDYSFRLPERFYKDIRDLNALRNGLATRSFRKTAEASLNGKTSTSSTLQESVSSLKTRPALPIFSLPAFAVDRDILVTESNAKLNFLAPGNEHVTFPVRRAARTAAILPT
jgi:hypothetical protein